MQISVLIQPISEGRFRVRAAEPFSLSCEGSSVSEATEMLRTQVEDLLKSGASLSSIQVSNPSGNAPVNLDFERLPDDDWFVQSMREAFEESRAQEEAAP